MLKKVLATALIMLAVGSPAWADPPNLQVSSSNGDPTDGKAIKPPDTVNVSITDSKTLSGAPGTGYTYRKPEFSGVVETEEYPPPTHIVDYVSPQVASGIPNCDGSKIVPVASNVIIQCFTTNGNTNRVGDPAPDAVVQMAKNYFQSRPLPVPKPEISAPNGGICGVIHSLDLHMPVEKIYDTPDTDFGDISVHAYGYVTVDWGDGSVGHYTTGGAPYPNSAISHSWTTKGFYNINVTVNWQAVVTVGPYEGQMYEVDLAGLSTQGSIQNWRVWEAQAVITS